MGRQGDQEVAAEAVDARKAAIWSVLAALGHLGLVAVGAGHAASDALLAIAYPLMLPLVAVLHVRHAPVRRSGAVLGTLAGVAVVAIGPLAAVEPRLLPTALVSLTVWWWTIGKMWLETGVLARALGVISALLAALALVAAALPIVIAAATASAVAAGGHVVVALWLIAVAAALWRRPDVPSA
ncbi:MAG: hypothetical protein KGN00_01925 [Chloroflexota bacterium]|nr:hypothetical protein [Chloroflexota bacterium]MDE3192423.1 hypothetical protein [Chloroflexota bacterium]